MPVGDDSGSWPENVLPPLLRGVEITGKLRAGTRSIWYRGEQISLGREVAVKLLRPELAAVPGLRDAFIEAGRKAAGLVHPSALTVINVFPDQNSIVFEMPRGWPLDGMVGKLPPVLVCRIALDVIDALTVLHATGRTHGNLGPGNIFLEHGGKALVMDFFQPARFEAEGMPAYRSRAAIAPEIESGADGDWKSDLFSLAGVLRASLRRKEVPPALDALLTVMIDPNPAKRGGSPADILSSFQRIREGEERRRGLSDGRLRGRRNYRRVPAEITVEMKTCSTTPSQTASILSKIKDISENGVFVAAADMLPVGTIVALNFTPQGRNARIGAYGLVRWHSLPPMPSGMGVQFVEIMLDDRHALMDYLVGDGNSHA